MQSNTSTKDFQAANSSDRILLNKVARIIISAADNDLKEEFSQNLSGSIQIYRRPMTGNLQIPPIELTDNRRSYEFKNAVSEELHLFPSTLQLSGDRNDIVLFSALFSNFQLLFGV